MLQPLLLFVFFDCFLSVLLLHESSLTRPPSLASFCLVLCSKVPPKNGLFVL